MLEHWSLIFNHYFPTYSHLIYANMSVTESGESWQFIFSKRSSRKQQTIKQGVIPVAEIRRIAHFDIPSKDN